LFAYTTACNLISNTIIEENQVTIEHDFRVDRLLRLIMTLLVSIATIERSFLAMKEKWDLGF